MTTMTLPSTAMNLSTEPTPEASAVRPARRFVAPPALPAADVGIIFRAVHALFSEAATIEIHTHRQNGPHSVKHYANPRTLPFPENQFLVDEVEAACGDPTVEQIDFVLNPLPANWSGTVAADADIAQRRWFMVDFVPRVSGNVAPSDSELAQAREKLNQVRSWLAQHGWPEPLIAESSHGWQLLYRIDLPGDDGGLISRCLEALASRFNTDHVAIDLAAGQAAHACQLYGTVSRKFEHTFARPQRLSRLNTSNGPFEIVPQELLEQLSLTETEMLRVAEQNGPIPPQSFHAGDESRRPQTHPQIGNHRMCNITDITIDEELEKLLPLLTAEESTELVANVKQHGFTDPLIIWRGRGVLIDGHNRFRIWKEELKSDPAKAPRIEERDFANDGAAREFMLRRQLARRNLNDALRIEIAKQLEPVLKAQARANQAAGGGDQKSAVAKSVRQKSDKPIRVDAEVAKLAGVSRDKVHKYDVVMKNGDDATKAAVSSGEMPIHTGYRKTREQAETQTQSSPTAPLAVKAQGLRLAKKAIEFLKQIPKDDVELHEAWNLVEVWMQENWE